MAVVVAAAIGFADSIVVDFAGFVGFVAVAVAIVVEDSVAFASSWLGEGS